jgi:hypothetical protein
MSQQQVYKKRSGNKEQDIKQAAKAGRLHQLLFNLPLLDGGAEKKRKRSVA